MSTNKTETLTSIGSIEPTEYDRALWEMKLKALAKYITDYQQELDRRQILQSVKQDRTAYINELVAELTSGR